VTRNAPPRNADEDDNGGLLALAVGGLAVGALAGLVGSAFHLALDSAHALRLAVLAWAHRYPEAGWLAPVLLAAIAAYVARWIVARFAPQASGSGVQQVEAVIRAGAPPMSGAVLPVKFVGGVLALGTGMALGQEGPTVQMGATIGHLWSRLLKLRAEDGRALLAAGAGAGLAAAFNAPLAGAIFVFEELLRRFELRVAIATLAACSAGLVVMRMLIGDRLVFSVPPIVVSLFPGYFFFLVLGAVIGVLGVLYSRMVVAGLDAAERLRYLRPEAQAAIVGAIVGLVAWVGDVAIGSGEDQVQAALDGGHTFSLVAIVFLVRLVLGPLCYAPGLPGGLFAPLLVIGSFAGLLIGKTMEPLVPGLTPPLPAIAAVGMGALFVAVVRAPVTGIALVVEMTGVTSLFIPLLTACASATAVPALLGSRPIYDTLQERDAGHRESAER
jgi:CIC family chloride channel protein